MRRERPMRREHPRTLLSLGEEGEDGNGWEDWGREENDCLLSKLDEENWTDSYLYHLPLGLNYYIGPLKFED